MLLHTVSSTILLSFSVGGNLTTALLFHALGILHDKYEKKTHEMHKIFFADHLWGINCASFVHSPTFAFLIAHAHSCTGRQVPDEGRRRDVRRAEGGGGEGGGLGAEAVHSRVR